MDTYINNGLNCISSIENFKFTIPNKTIHTIILLHTTNNNTRFSAKSKNSITKNYKFKYIFYRLSFIKYLF